MKNYFEILLGLDFATVWDACIELVTVNGRPFQLMNDSGFRMIVDKVLEGLGCSSRINQENIRKHVSIVARKIKDDLRNELKHRLVSLKIDCVTRLGRAIIGINLQFVRDGRIHLRTLAMAKN